MRHRIRAAGLILQHDYILLVLHQNPANGIEIWVPPGGGLIAKDRSIFDAATREIFEETGLTVQVNRISHIREFRDIDNNIHHIEFFMPVESYSGELSIRNVPPGDEDELFIKDVRLNKLTISEFTITASNDNRTINWVIYFISRPKDVQWIRKTDLSRITVYPEWLQSDTFWEEARQQFPETRYTESTSGTSKFMFGYAPEKKKIRG